MMTTTWESITYLGNFLRFYLINRAVCQHLGKRSIVFRLSKANQLQLSPCF